MEIKARHIKHAATERCDCLVLPVFAKGKLATIGTTLDQASGGALARLTKNEGFAGTPGKSLLLHEVPGITAARVLLLGCGDPGKLDSSALDDILRHAMAVLQSCAAGNATFLIDELAESASTAGSLPLQFALSGGASGYRYTHTLSAPDATPRLRKLVYGTPDKVSAATLRAIDEGLAMALGVNLARELGNLPANICTPSHLADQAQALAARHQRLHCKVIDEKKMASLGMGALLAVTAGAQQPAKLIVIEYRGAAREQPPHVLVGKGVTFDSGGISLKPGAGMDEMKFDMCGAASVFGALEAIATLQPAINVVGIVPACENLPGGSAVRPGDVVKSMSGTTIEVLNTDAEGRLILCDALSYAQRFKPESLIDIATLTGACVIALGKHASGLFGNDETLLAQLIEAGQATHDRAWHMPLWDDYQEQLKSNFADVANVGGREAGSVTAACFLSRFTREQRWAHLDIAGTAWEKGTRKGATGRPVALLVRYLLDRAAAITTPRQHKSPAK